MTATITFENSKFLNDLKSGPKELVVVPLMNATTRSALEIQWTGQLATNGISVAEFNNAKAYSFGFKFDDKENIGFLYEPFDKLFNNNSGWIRAPLMKNDTLFFKLKVKDGVFRHSSNVKMNPENVHSLPLARMQKMTVDASVHAYFDLKKKIYGIYFTVNHLEIDGDDLKAVEEYYKF